MGLFPQQSTHFVANHIGQRCDGFCGYPRQEHADSCIDDEIDRNIHGSAHAGVVKAVIKEYVQGLHNQKLPHNP